MREAMHTDKCGGYVAADIPQEQVSRRPDADLQQLLVELLELLQRELVEHALDRLVHLLLVIRRFRGLPTILANLQRLNLIKTINQVSNGLPSSSLHVPASSVSPRQHVPADPPMIEHLQTHLQVRSLAQLRTKLKAPIPKRLLGARALQLYVCGKESTASSAPVQHVCSLALHKESCSDVLFTYIRRSQVNTKHLATHS